jgi:anti-anti-sigma factor
MWLCDSAIADANRLCPIPLPTLPGMRFASIGNGRNVMMGSANLFEVECRGSVVVVTPMTSLGEFTFEQLAAEATNLLESLDEQMAKNIVVDFGKTDYVGSSALGFLLKLWKSVRQREGRMALCNVSAHEHEILRLTKLDTLWPVYPSRDAALETLAKPSRDLENV